ncbi:MAG: EGFR-like transmembrane domain-containing protein [Pyrinomonadaceae bacterium]
MKRTWFFRFLVLTLTAASLVCGVFAQANKTPQIKSREVSDDDIPVLTKHLPDWENARNRSTYILNQADLRNALGSRPALDLIEFESGTEAVTAPYEQGKLLLIEFTTPQASVDADEKIKQTLSETPQTSLTVYRRIGNYNAFVFDARDEASANALLDQIKYEKDIQWLGRNPFLLRRAERAFVESTANLFLATTTAIVGGIGLSVLAGIAVGIFFFYLRERKRAAMETFSDAGGMTRLNLDGFTPQTPSERLLKD